MTTVSKIVVTNFINITFYINYSPKQYRMIKKLDQFDINLRIYLY
jgi:hypothetical protein